MADLDDESYRRVPPPERSGRNGNVHPPHSPLEKDHNARTQLRVLGGESSQCGGSGTSDRGGLEHNAVVNVANELTRPLEKRPFTAEQVQNPLSQFDILTILDELAQLQQTLLREQRERGHTHAHSEPRGIVHATTSRDHVAFDRYIQINQKMGLVLHSYVCVGMGTCKVYVEPSHCC